MASLKIQITEFVDKHNPGWVKCELMDAWNQTWQFIEKIPVVATVDLWVDSQYPQPTSISCEIVRRWRDATNREIVTVDTEKPWGIESTTGKTCFDVLVEQLEEQ